MSALIAVLPARVRRRWDAIALQQLADRALQLHDENDELRSKLRWAEDCAFMYEQEVDVMREGGRIGMTVHGRIVNIDASPGATIDDDPEYRA